MRWTVAPLERRLPSNTKQHHIRSGDSLSRYGFPLLSISHVDAGLSHRLSYCLHLDDIAVCNRLGSPNGDATRKSIRNWVFRNFNYSKPSTIYQYLCKIICKLLSVGIFILPIHNKILTCIIGSRKAFLNRSLAPFGNAPWSALTPQIAGFFFVFVKLILQRFKLAIAEPFREPIKRDSCESSGRGRHPKLSRMRILIADIGRQKPGDRYHNSQATATTIAKQRQIMLTILATTFSMGGVIQC